MLAICPIIGRGAHEGERQEVTEILTGRGPAAGEVLDLAEDLGTDLTAVASRGLDARLRVGFGSVSTEVLHTAKGPAPICPDPRSRK